MKALDVDCPCGAHVGERCYGRTLARQTSRAHPARATIARELAAWRRAGGIVVDVREMCWAWWRGEDDRAGVKREPMWKLCQRCDRLYMSSTWRDDGSLGIEMHICRLYDDGVLTPEEIAHARFGAGL